MIEMRCRTKGSLAPLSMSALIRSVSTEIGSGRGKAAEVSPFGGVSAGLTAVGVGATVGFVSIVNFSSTISASPSGDDGREDNAAVRGEGAPDDVATSSRCCRGLESRGLLFAAAGTSLSSSSYSNSSSEPTIVDPSVSCRAGVPCEPPLWACVTRSSGMTWRVNSPTALYA